MTVRQDFQTRAGATVSLTFEVPGADFLSATSITWRLASSPNGEAVLTKTDASGISVGGDEEITITISASDVTDWGLYYHSLEKVSGGVTYPLAQGRGVFRPSPQAA